MLTNQEIFKYVDHTLLKQTAVWEEYKQLCDDAVFFGTASVCVPPDRVAAVKEYLAGRIPVCTVIGFPNGHHLTEVKAFETKKALEDGAEEIDMVINIGALKEGRDDYVREEIRTLKEICGSRILKVIVETCFLTEEEKIRVCRIVTEAGADFIKTSTGFGGGGATFEDVALFAAHVGPNVKIKASGGIASFDDARQFISLGASRLGTSRLVTLARQGKD
jgi:deoxyribose-phosphate aldolase